MLRLSLPAELSNLHEFRDRVTVFAEESGFPANKVRKLRLALEEALVNIINHAYPSGEKGDAEVCCWVDKDQLILEMRDQGPPFDPFCLPPPELGGDLTHRPIGGLGVFMIRRLVDSVRYERRDNMNVLVMRISKEP